MAARRSKSSSAIPMNPIPTPQPTISNISQPTPNWFSDRFSILLLVLLYAAQGLPVGLAFGTIPFLLKEHGSSYATLAHFSLASLPYSLKLIIAPIVDTFYSPAFGRRKSWIVPIQLALGFVMLLFSNSIHNWVKTGNVTKLMPTFLFIITLVATQDIAVDGWSLTILSKQNVSYASTCQSLGLSIGYFATFTIFLAFTNPEFCNNYARRLLPGSGTGPLMDLRLAMRMVGVYYLILTAYVTFGKTEHSSKKADETSRKSLENEQTSPFSRICSTYQDVMVAIRLPAVQSLVISLLIAKVGFSAYDNVATLKLLELGFSKESMATLAVIQAPFSLLGTVITGRLVAKKSPIHVYLAGYACRVLLSLTGPLCVAWLASQNGVVSPAYYLAVLLISILYSLAAECLMFIGMGAFFLNVTHSSVHVAGSYLTLLNTSSNMGGLWHKAIILWLVDKLTIRQDCGVEEQPCPILYDGYYVISFFLLPLAIAIGFYLLRKLPKLGHLPDSAWRASR